MSIRFFSTAAPTRRPTTSLSRARFAGVACAVAAGALTFVICALAFAASPDVVVVADPMGESMPAAVPLPPAR